MTHYLLEPVICGLLILIGFMVGGTPADVLYILAIVIGGYKQTVEGIKDSITNRRINVELLMIMSAIGACILGDMREGALLIFIFSFAGALEDITTNRSNKDIRALMELQPHEAHKLVNGEVVVVSVDDLQIGDHVIVSNGKAVPVDGTILRGSSAFDESSISGEALPKNKKEGDLLYAGTVNVSSPVTVEITSSPDDILLKKIIKMVEEAKEHQSSASTRIDQIEGWYAIAVIVAVTFTILIPWLFMGTPFEEAAYTGIVLLVVASPCALIASVTPATLSAISNGTKRGILVKGGKYFNILSEVNAIALDKTGTLTYGVPTLNDMYFDCDMTTHFKAIVFLEQHSSHPLAKAIVRDLNIPVDTSLTSDDIDEIPGYGIIGTVGNYTYRVGSKAFIPSIPDSITKKERGFAQAGSSRVYVAIDDVCCGFFVITDLLKEEAQSFITWLKSANITPIMITGDIEETARYIADDIGIDHVIARCLPDQKMTYIEKLKEKFNTVAMVGDGINDAAALANASVGIAMGHGTDIAIESADIVLMKQNLMNIKYAILLSKRLQKIVKQNIVFSMLVIVVLISLNFLHVLPLPIGVIGHEGSTILVILNSLRLLKPLKNEN